jgi:flagellar hook-basal body complex protein FliE
MAAEPMAAVAAATAVEPFTAPLAGAPPASGFADWFTRELRSVNTGLINADNDIQRLALGETRSLHEVMIHMEEARLSFQLLAQVRNRLLEAYQEVMRMQV